MKHLLALLLLVAGIVYFATYKSAVDKLMVPVTGYTEAQTGNRFVELDRALLPVTPHYLAVPGVTTIVYFHDKNCAACLQMDVNLADFLRQRPDVAVRKVSMTVEGDAYYQAIRDFKWKVWMAPAILIFDKKGKLLAADDGTDFSGGELLDAWMEKEAKKAVHAASHLAPPPHAARRMRGAARRLRAGGFPCWPLRSWRA